MLRKSGLDAKITPNKDTVMVLPPTVDKGIGVATAVAHYGETRSIYLTCFGDGENDLALFAPADFRVAMANSVPALKEIADVVTEAPGGLGVEEYLRKRYFGSQ
ncbi:MAG: HAD hydrolase family protein [Thaumarchaeota archaeon]|nr:HAD hydrolase family protein [Nitrososphaerota archaeon]